MTRHQVTTEPIKSPSKDISAQVVVYDDNGISERVLELRCKHERNAVDARLFAGALADEQYISSVEIYFEDSPVSH